MTTLYWNSSEYGNDLQLTMDDARSGSHGGACDEDIAALRRVRYVAEQLDKIDPDSLRCELREFGAWDAADLSDDDQNLNRWLWISCNDIRENN